MKKLLLIIALVVFVFSANAQESKLNIGGTIGLPLGDANTLYDVMGAVEANYLFRLSDRFQLGLSVNYVYFNGKETSESLLPLTVALRYNVFEKFTVGADLGHAFSIVGGIGGGLYYRPILGYKASEAFTIHAAYSGFWLGGEGNLSSIGIGGTYTFSL